MFFRRRIAPTLLAAGAVAGAATPGLAQSQLLPQPAECGPVPACLPPTACPPAGPVCPPVGPVCLPAPRVRVIVPPPEVVFREAGCGRPACGGSALAAPAASAPAAAPAAPPAMATLTHTYTVPYLTYQMVPVATHSFVGGASFNAGLSSFGGASFNAAGLSSFGVQPAGFAAGGLPASFAVGGLPAASFGVAGVNAGGLNLVAAPPAAAGLSDGEVQSFRALLGRLRGGDTRPTSLLTADRGDAAGLTALMAALADRDCDSPQKRLQADIERLARVVNEDIAKRIKELSEGLVETNGAVWKEFGAKGMNEPATLRDWLRQLQTDLEKVKKVDVVAEGLKKAN